MLHPRTVNGIRIYTSPLLESAGVPHAFSTRVGGVSEPPFDSMNLGNPNGCAVQDQSPNIAENYRRLQEAIGCERHHHCYVHQVHGGEVLIASTGERFDNNQKADALASTDPGQLLSIRVADCVPVLLSSREGRVVAAAHAGWRGVVARVVPNALATMQTLVPGLMSSEALAAIGPSIGFDSFEVGPEVLDEFDRDFAGVTRRYPGTSGKGMVDLREAIRQQLVALSVPAAQIDTTDRDTFRDGEEFFSHRRENGVTGRMAAMIAPRPPAG